MKVKISYTVELEEIPQRIAQLVEECTSAIKASTTTVEKSFNDNLVKNGNVMAAMHDLEVLRSALFKADQQMAEYSSLLSNLQKAYAIASEASEEKEDDPS